MADKFRSAAYGGTRGKRAGTDENEQCLGGARGGFGGRWGLRMEKSVSCFSWDGSQGEQEWE